MRAALHKRITERGFSEWKDDLRYADEIWDLGRSGYSWKAARRLSADMVRRERHWRARWLRLC